MDPDEYRDFLCRWYAELIESYSRFYQYILQRTANAPASGRLPPPLLSELRADICRDFELLIDLATSVRVGGRLNEWDYQTLFTNAQVYANKLGETHYPKATLVPAPWVRPELATVFAGVMQERLTETALASLNVAKSWNIVLSSEFNFSNVVMRQAEFEVEGLRHVVSLPVSEDNNVVMWPNLFHEAGHSVLLQEELTQEIKQLESEVFYHHSEKSYVDRDYLAVVDSWIPEIFADLFAIDLVGPAYFSSFSAFAAYWHPRPLRAASDQHPSCQARLSYLHHRLKQTSPEAAESDSVSSAWHRRLALDTDFHPDSLVPSTKESWPKDEMVARFAAGLVELPAYQRLFRSPLRLDYDKIRDLQVRVARSEFIATTRQSGQFAETPNSIVDILTAGVFHRLSVMLDQKSTELYKRNGLARYYEELLFCMVGSMEHTERDDLNHLIRAGWKTINDQSAAVSKSIESREIVMFYQTRRLVGGDAR